MAVLRARGDSNSRPSSPPTAATQNEITVYRVQSSGVNRFKVVLRTSKEKILHCIYLKKLKVCNVIARNALDLVSYTGRLY